MKPLLLAVEPKSPLDCFVQETQEAGAKPFPGITQQSRKGRRASLRHQQPRPSGIRGEQAL